MGTSEVVELLPLLELLAEVHVVDVAEQLVELDDACAVGALDVPVQSRGTAP